MHAIRQHDFGPPEILVLEELPDPEPGPGQVRVVVAAAGVHLVDTMVRRGAAPPAFPRLALPMTPGREVAGTVDDVGPGVDDTWIGRRVVAHLGMAHGGYADRALANEEALHVLPEHLAPATAVAMVGTGRTAMSVLDGAALGPGDVALVTGAAGGLGSLLVQAARAAGATVVALAGGAGRVAQVRRLGADVAVDTREPDWEDALVEELGDRELTVVLDGVGGAVGETGLSLLTDGGRLVLFGFSSGTATRLSERDLWGRGLSASVVVGPHAIRRAGGLRALEQRALAAAASGELVPLVGSPFPLAEAAAAHAAVEARSTLGKVVLLPQWRGPTKPG